jgi:hypothetical protein
MADDQRVYSDEEFALILRTASELASQSDRAVVPSNGLTLVEMQSAAAQAGIDPALVEQAARQLASRAAASPFDRVIGGPLRHDEHARFRGRLDEESAARLLSAIRLSATHLQSINDGHSSALGVTWQASSDGNVISIVAKPDENGVSASVVIDRRGTFLIAGALSSFAIMMSVLMGMGFYDEMPLIAPWIPVAGAAGTLAVVRSFWVSSTRKVREQIGVFMDVIGKTVAQKKGVRGGVDAEGKRLHSESARRTPDDTLQTDSNPYTAEGGAEA